LLNNVLLMWIFFIIWWPVLLIQSFGIPTWFMDRHLQLY
jgi:hypothetical protein